MDRHPSKKQRMDDMTFGRPGDKGEKVDWDSPTQEDTDHWDDEIQMMEDSVPIPQFNIPSDGSSEDNPQQEHLDECAQTVLTYHKAILQTNPEFRYSSLLYYMNLKRISVDLLNNDYTGFTNAIANNQYKQWIEEEKNGYDEFYDDWTAKTKDRKWQSHNVPSNPIVVEHCSLYADEWKNDPLFWSNMVNLFLNRFHMDYIKQVNGVTLNTIADLEFAFSKYNTYEEFSNGYLDDENIFLSEDNFGIWLAEEVDTKLHLDRQEFLVKRWQNMNGCTPTLGNGVPRKLREFAQQGIFFILFFF